MNIRVQERLNKADIKPAVLGVYNLMRKADKQKAVIICYDKYFDRVYIDTCNPFSENKLSMLGINF